MAYVYAPPNFERTGVVAGFVLSPGTGLTPTISKGVLFAQGLMYRPAEAPVLTPDAPANAMTWLFYNSGAGFYWSAGDQPTYSPTDAFLGWVLTDATSVKITSSQLIAVADPPGTSRATGGGFTGGGAPQPQGGGGSLIDDTLIRWAHRFAGADGGAQINAAIADLPASGGIVMIREGTWFVSTPIVNGGKTNVALIGYGRGYTDFNSSPVIIRSAAGYGGDLLTFSGSGGTRLENITFYGPGVDAVGGGRVALNTGAGQGNTQGVVVRNVLIQDVADDGLVIDTPILCVLENVKALRCALNGILMTNGTSVTITSCYGITCSRGAGVHLDTMSYCTIQACASEVCGIGYWLTNCQNIAMIACGSEDQIRRMASPKSWATTTAYAVGDIIVPKDTYVSAAAGYGGNSRVYKCIVAGTSAAGEPTWPLAVNSTVVDSGVTWQEAGLVGDAFVVENSHHCALISCYSRNVDGHHFVFRGGNCFLNTVLAPRSWISHPLWTATTAVTGGSKVVPTAANGHFYYAQGAEGAPAGVTGSSEPAWPTTPAATVADGTVTWIEGGLIAAEDILVQGVFQGFAAAGAQTFIDTEQVITDKAALSVVIPKTNNLAAIIGGLTSVLNTAGTSWLQSKVVADTANRFHCDAKGAMGWGPGNATLDTFLERISAGRLKASGVLEVTDTIVGNSGMTLVNALGLASGGTGGATAAAARTSLDVYSKAEVDALLATKASSTHTHSGLTGSAGDPAHQHSIGAP